MEEVNGIIAAKLQIILGNNFKLKIEKYSICKIDISH